MSDVEAPSPPYAVASIVLSMGSIAVGNGLLFALGGCGVTGPIKDTVRSFAEAETEQERAVVQRIVRGDLEEALRSAENHGDKVAAACWRGILARLDALDGGYFTEVKGAFSGFQKARNVRRALSGDSGQDIRIACAALRDDSRSAILGIARLVGIPVP